MYQTIYPTPYQDPQRMMHALQTFRHQRQQEASEFAAEFQRLETTQKDCLAVLEAAGLPPLLNACSSMLRGSTIRLVWLRPTTGSRIAACFAGQGEDIEQALHRGREAAAAIDSTITFATLPEPPDALRHALLHWQQPGSNTPERPHYMPIHAGQPAVPNQQAGSYLLEMTDDELRRMAIALSPDISRAGLNAMRKEELVDLCSRLRPANTAPPHI